MSRVISIFGTSSDAGKSTITFILGKIFQEFGLKVAPFKAQNVSNNATVADDNSEIAYSQYFQALALKEKTSWQNNPILLKSGGKNLSYLVLRGKAIKKSSIKDYYKNLDRLKPVVKEAMDGLLSEYDLVVAEGAGSPVELNLMDKDLSNLFIAKEYNSKIIIVADIEKGGVFASVYGVYHLLPKELQKRVAGVVINKFRGDLRLFDEGIRIIEEEFKIPVLGVLPYFEFNLGFEDSQSLKNYSQIQKKEPTKRVGIISYPTISNYNDFEPLIVNPDFFVEFIDYDRDLEGFDLVILPGSKLVMRDLRWLKRIGLFDRLKRREKEILGVCGGYEMMFEELIDEDGVESEIKKEEGLGFIDDRVYFQKEKVVKRGVYDIFGKRVNGFEMHSGVSRRYPLLYQNRNIKGTFIHSLFDDEEFKNFQTAEIEKFVSKAKEYLDLERVKNIIY